MVSNLVGGDAAMIELEQLVAGYDGVAITPPLSGMICPGSLTAIVGLNGCGKSTLLKTLAGFLPPVSGRLRWQGKRPVIGWLAQRHALESQFPLNVQDVVSQGAWPGVSLLRGLGGGTRRRIGAVLERVGLAGLAKTPIEALSGGQFQRMLFARVAPQQARWGVSSSVSGKKSATRWLSCSTARMVCPCRCISRIKSISSRLVASSIPVKGSSSITSGACWGATRAVLPAFSHVRSA